MIIDYKFTSAGAKGRSGPSQAQLNTAYKGTQLEGKVTSSLGVQEWTVPFNGKYLIKATGAQGGGTYGGKGAQAQAEFMLQAGQKLKIIVGQRGDTGVSGTYLSGGGGGGSFVTLSDNSPLVVAGGGGGNVFYNKSADGRAASSGGSTYASGGGVNGSGGKNGHTDGPASGGGGLIGDGEASSGGTGGKSFVNGGFGGFGYSSSYGYSTSDGGFGGGGGAWHNGYQRPGGGGGYSGGQGGTWSGSSPNAYGGGGGSYVGGQNILATAGINVGDGTVIISNMNMDIPTSPIDFDKNDNQTVYLSGESIRLQWGASTTKEVKSLTYEIDFTEDGLVWKSMKTGILELFLVASFSSISTDKYQFRVRGKDPDGVYSEYTLSKIFKVRKQVILIEDGTTLKAIKNGVIQVIQ